MNIICFFQNRVKWKKKKKDPKPGLKFAGTSIIIKLIPVQHTDTDNKKESKSTSSKGSVSDHLANERTFLAWIRTGIGIMAFGFVVVKFTLFVKQISLALQRPLPVPSHGYSSVIGIFLVGFGALLSLLAFLRYKLTGMQLEDASYKPSTVLTTILVTSILLIGCLLVVYLIHSVEA